MKQKKDTFNELKEISKNLRTTGSATATESVKPKENSAPSPLAENEIQNVKNDGSVETILIEEEDEPKSKRGRPKKKLSSYSYAVKSNAKYVNTAIRNRNRYTQPDLYL
jgi:hypothetical protein